jgi:hypothetical protein
MVLACVLAGATVQPGTPAPRPGAFGPMLTARLSDLRPDRPEDYLRLAEELVALDAAAHLVVPLCVHALHAGRESAPRTAASAALLLASVVPDAGLASRCRVLAAQFDPRRVGPTPDPTAQIDPAALDAARCLAAVLAGDAHRARDLLRQAEVRSVVDRIGALADAAAPDSASDFLRRQLEGFPCRECRGDGTKKTDATSHELCLRCGGQTRPSLDPRLAEAMLVEQARLLAPVSLSWSAHRAADAGRPLRDPSPVAIADALGVDLSRPVWRDGRWAVP